MKEPRTLRRVLAALLALALTGPAAAQQDDGETRRILVFGDSLTWGWVPTEPITPTTRHAPEDRWTGALAEGLGEGYELVVEGLSARTTNIDDPSNPILNGADYLPPALASHEPLDLVIILLGTNDTKTYLDRTPFEIGLGAGELVNIVQEWDWSFTDYAAPEVLLISPPPLGETIAPGAAEIFEGSREKSMALPEVYSAIADAAGADFFDAGTVIETDGVDGIHFTAQTNRTLGEAVAEKVQTMMP